MLFVLPADLTPLWLSLRSATLAVLLVAPLGVLAARRVQRWRGLRRSLADLVLLAPLVLPPTVLGFVLLQLLGGQGPIGMLLESLGVSLVFSWPATVLSSAVVSFPLMYRAALAAFEQIDPSLPEVARSLGADESQVLCRILLPLALPGLVAGVSLSFARALGEFGTTLMLAGNIPGRTQTLPLAIFAAVDAGDIGGAWRLTALVLLLNACSLLLLERLVAPAASRRQAPDTRNPADFGEAAVETGISLVHTVAEGPPPAQGPSQLEVRLLRPLGGFPLRIAFRSNSRRLAVLGASGAGKSQLLRCLAGLERPASGRIALNGRTLFDAEGGIDLPLRRRRIGLVPQHYALFPHLTVAANVSFSLASLPRAERGRRVGLQLEHLGLSALAERYPAQLSGGQQQRVALARALASEPELLLLDEPFAAQDAYLRPQLQQQLADVLAATGVPALLVTHDLEEAYRLSDELLVIDHGRVLAQGQPQQVFEQPSELAVARLSGCKNLSRLRPLAGGRLSALDWGLDLPPGLESRAGFSHVGIRATHLRLEATPAPQEVLPPDPGPNQFLNQRLDQRLNQELNQWPVWLLKASEGPFQVSAYVVLEASHGLPGGDEGAAPAALHVKLTRAQWLELREQPQPWWLTMPIERLLLLRQSQPLPAGA